MKKILIITLIFIGLAMATTPALATTFEPGSTGWKIKEIIWDAGWVWIIMLTMGLAVIFDIVRGIIIDAKGGREEVEKKKPSYEIIVRRKIE
jgi:hypothetical protein